MDHDVRAGAGNEAARPSIRPASDADMAGVQAIYAHHVLNGTGSFEEIPPSVAVMRTRLAAVAGQGGAWLVAEDGSGLLGYAYAARYHVRSGFRFTAEDSVYVRPDAQGRGVGTALLVRLLDAAAMAGFAQMVAAIGGADNAGSIALHARCGFRLAGWLEAVGFKAGRWHDLVLMQRALEHDPIKRNRLIG